MILTKGNKNPVNLDEMVDQKISSGKIEELLMIVPTNRKLRHIKKELISNSPRSTATGINIETLGTISAKLLRVSKSFSELSEAASTVLIKQSAAEVDLKYLSLYGHEIPFGTLERIKNVISEYKKHNIKPDHLRKEAEQLDKSERLKALDIAAVYECYQTKTDTLVAYETGDIYKRLTDIQQSNFEENFRKLYPSVNFILFNGFDEFTHLEIDIVESLAMVKDAILYINFDYYKYNPMLFYHLDECFSRFEERGFVSVKDKSYDESKHFIKSIRENLFQKQKRVIENYKESIIKITAPDRRSEVELIAKEIKQLISAGKCEPNEICIAFNLIQPYSSYVRDIFSAYGIPINLTDRYSLDNSLPITAIVSFLEIIENDFYYKNIFRAIHTDFISLDNIDISNLQKIATQHNIVGGRINWINTISEAIDQLYFSDLSEDNFERQKKRLTQARKDINTIYSYLKPFDQKITIREFVENLEFFIYKSGILTKLIDVSGLDSEKNIKSVSTFVETVYEIFELLEKEDSEDEKYGISFYLDNIRTAAGWARYNVKEKSEFGVLVTTLNEIRGLNYNYLFISGLCDGDFPTRYSPEIFFSGSFSKKETIHQTEERFRFYQSLSVWNKMLYLTSPAKDEMKDLVESTFIKDFQDSFTITYKTESDYDKLICSSEDLLIYSGKEDLELLSRSDIKFDTKDIGKKISIDKLRLGGIDHESEYNGYLSLGDFDSWNKGCREKLEEFVKRQFSVSQLETFAQCPFKFFIERLLNIDVIEDPTEEIGAMELGLIIHDILYEFYISLRRMKINFNSTEEKIKKLSDILFDIAESKLDSPYWNSPNSFWEREKLLGIAGDKKESILYKFLINEIEDESGFIPKYFEVSFGKMHRSKSDEELSSSNPVLIDDVELRGKIDRVEVNSELSSFNVVDYKLSKNIPKNDELWKGQSLQLPLYLHAAKLLLKEKYAKDFDYGDMFIYSMKYLEGDFGKKKISVVSRKQNDSVTTQKLVDSTLENIKNYVEQIRKGEFNLTKIENRKDKICKYCDFASICRISEVSE